MADDQFLTAYHSLEEAKEAGKGMALKNSPKSSKVAIFELIGIIEPRRIEFAEKTFNASGELLV